MKRDAFTMIELVFVIVILGILAAVAIPKLNATRNDAKVSALAMSLATGVQEVANYAVSRGQIENSLAIMSNNFVSLEAQGDANLSDKKAVIKAGEVSDCITLDINSTSTDEILSLSFKPSGGNDQMCMALQSLIDIRDYPIVLRGQYVVK
jgi:prepilin-type N-terminal cleavage/methylation domain-containing protein